MGDVYHILGMQININYKEKTINIIQRQYTTILLEKFSRNKLTFVLFPVEMEINLEKYCEKVSDKEINQYQKEFGSLIYLPMITRSEITYTMKKYARFMSNPNASHLKALERVWKYINGNPKIGLFCDCGIINQSIFGDTDSDWRGDILSRKSASGYIFLSNKNITSWMSMLQKTIAL